MLVQVEATDRAVYTCGTNQIQKYSINFEQMKSNFVFFSLVANNRDALTQIFCHVHFLKTTITFVNLEMKTNVTTAA